MQQVLNNILPDNSSDAKAFHIYDLTWNIPKSYGGMTSAMLYRCEQFTRFGIGSSVTILTLAVGLDPEEVQSSIQKRWNIPESVKVKNIWDDLRKASDDELQSLPGATASSAPDALMQDGLVEQQPYMRVQLNDEGDVIRREHLRVDGSLLLSDAIKPGKSRELVLYNSLGKAIKKWRYGSDLYLSWIDYAMSQRPAILINEDKRISEFLYKNNFSDTRIVQVIHGSHLSEKKLAPFGKLLKQRTNTLKNLEQFDAVGVLTERQKTDIEALGVDAANIRLLPNATSPRKLEHEVLVNRPANTGAVVGKLTALKRVEHSVKAIHALNRSGFHPKVTLDVMGDGELRESLEDLNTQLGNVDSERVRFLGLVSDAASRLRDYSFLLLTSTTEGQPLVLLEAMAQGCIPIAYDIRYGPSDLIIDGVNGFLVNPGDLDALERTIKYFVALPEARRSQMRKSAMEQVKRFYPAENMQRWSSLFAELWKRPDKTFNALPAMEGFVDSARISVDGCTLHGTITGLSENSDANFKVIVSSRDGSSFVKLVPELKQISETSVQFECSFTFNQMPQAKHSVLDFYLQNVQDPWSQKFRLLDGAPNSRTIHDSRRIYRTKEGSFSIDCQ